MTQLEFTNRIDGTINDFTSGAIDHIEFRSHILDTLIELAQGRFLDDQIKEFDYNLLEQWFIPSERNNPKAQHFRVNGMALILGSQFNSDHLLVNEKKIEEKLLSMGAEIAYYRNEGETFPTKGFWLEPTQKLLDML